MVGVRKLPVRQLAILCLVRFSEPISMTSVFPYLPAMIAGFDGVKPADVGFWSGLAGAIFSGAQCLTAIKWGRLSDKYGRKRIMLLGLINTMILSILWGFSTNLPMALLTRALVGAANGNAGILRTAVAEICPWKELQPRAFSIMPMIYSIGSIIGPSIGGGLANPLGRTPQDDPNKSNSIFWKFPYLLPNIVAAGFFLVSIAIGWLFLRETLEERRDVPDLGLATGEKLVSLCRDPIGTIKDTLQGRHEAKYSALPASRHKADEEIAMKKLKTPMKAPTYREVLTKQTILYLISYVVLAMHNTSFDQMLPVMLHMASSGPDVQETNPPFRFSKGFGLDSGRIGLMFTIQGVFGTLYQFFVFPPLTSYFGVLNTLRVSMTMLPIVYFLTPYSVLIPNALLSQATLFLFWNLKQIFALSAFPSCTILFTNSASSLRVLGTVNGIATSLGAIGRAIGPSLAGIVFTWGVTNNYLVSSFWLMAFMGLIALPPLYFVVEGKGFGDDGEETESEGGVEDDESSPSADGPLAKDSVEKTRRQSTDMFEIAVDSDAEEYGETNRLLVPDHLPNARLGRETEKAKTGKRRRLSSSPIGAGQGFRRLSSNLGVSRSGLGSGAELGA